MSINGTTWNRSSAFSPEVLATLNSATERAFKNTFAALEEFLNTLSKKQRAEAIRLIAQRVVEGINAFAESLKK